MNSSKKLYIIFFLICFLGFFLRIYNIRNVPPGLNWDEAALGYNAYSLLKTGKDEYGRVLPINLKSFGDYKPALYSYLAIPFVAIFGLNEISVRMPSVLAGTGGIVLVYLLIHELFKIRTLALITALMVAVSPLGIHFSRPAFESNMAVFFNILGMYFFLKGLKKPNFFILAAIFWGLSLFTYQASRLFVLMLIISLGGMFWKKIKFSRELVIGLAIFLVILSLAGFSVIFQGESKRLEAVNFFAYSRSEEVISKLEQDTRLNRESIFFQLLYGEWFAYLKGLIERSAIYFSPKMLFINGDYNVRHRVPDLGVFYYLSIFFIPLGFYWLFKNWGVGAKLIIILLFIASIPAVLSRDLISMLRALNMLLPITFLEAAGVYLMALFFKRYGGKYLAIGLIVISMSLMVNLAIFFDRYFIHMPYEYSAYWLDGYKEAILTMEDLMMQKKYDKIVFTDSYGQPYIYYLFWIQYNPSEFQKQAKLEQSGVDVGTVRRIDNIDFRHVYWPADRGMVSSLFIGTLEELPDQDILPFKQFRVIKEIKFKDGKVALRIVETE